MSKISIVVPVYWNSDTLMLLYEDMREKILPKLGDYEIVFVDDGSGDNSWEIMNQIREMDNRVKLVRLSRNFGEHAAILAGLSQCTGDCAVTKQADLQEDSELILEMYEKWKQGNKVVLAVRSDRDEGPVQKFFANLYYTLMRKLVIKDMPKGGFDCYLLDRQVIQVLLMLDEKNSALTLQVLWVGFKSDKVYFHRKAREIGESRWTLSKKVKLVLDSMMSFSYFPIRFMSGLGVLFAVVGVIWAIVLMVQRMIGVEDVAGWTSMMVLMLFSFGVIMVMLGLLGEYIWRALDASRNRPPFLVDETRGFEKEEDQ
ncbi:MAG: glycosyltransferase family 2 protein [Lachnospiraceae bacterium]|jgi:glycosyltransferase involved in cell wall biosynthesis|nr:glycosyltransferase family 2 protein [Lachnospiraceae bacterium]MCI9132612.1 glycosyltransferase family 2 protein [Lachnospiraceae bacterium]